MLCIKSSEEMATLLAHLANSRACPIFINCVLASVNREVRPKSTRRWSKIRWNGDVAVSDIMLVKQSLRDEAVGTCCRMKYQSVCLEIDVL